MRHEREFGRRSFLKRAAAAAGGLLALPAIAPAAALGGGGRAAPSERIVVGWIGTGNRGSAVMGGFLPQKDVQVVAVCDVKKGMLDRAKKRIDAHNGGSGCQAYGDFRELVDRKDIEAVLVSSTDHWHVLHSIACARAGKDVYMEKPIGISMEQAQTLRKVFQEHGRIFQFGTQQRSDRKFRLACELVRNGKIGKLKTINVWSPGSSSGGSPEPVPVPAGIDYDFWLGPARYTPYTKDRCSNRLWWFVSDYALGFIAGWGIHPVDIAVWGADELLDSPVEVEGSGQFPKQGVADTAMNWRITWRYQSGVTMNFAGHPRPQEWTDRYKKTQSHGTAFEGTEGWVHVNRGLVNSEPAGLLETELGPGAKRLVHSDHHARNFLDSVRSRRPTVSPVEEAARGEAICQVSDLAIRLGRKLRWDPKKERFEGDDDANRRLKKPMRAPWKLST